MMPEQGVKNKAQSHTGENRAKGAPRGLKAEQHQQRADNHILSGQHEHRGTQHLKVFKLKKDISRGVDGKQNQNAGSPAGKRSFRLVHGVEKHHEQGQHVMEIEMLDGAKQQNLRIQEMIRHHEHGQDDDELGQAAIKKILHRCSCGCSAVSGVAGA